MLMFGKNNYYFAWSAKGIYMLAMQGSKVSMTSQLVALVLMGSLSR